MFDTHNQFKPISSRELSVSSRLAPQTRRDFMYVVLHSKPRVTD